METLHNLLKSMLPLKSVKNPAVASVLGFVFGPLGLGLYLWSFIDFVVPLLLYIVVFFVFAGIDLSTFFAGIVSGAVAATYGYFRVLTSNERLGEQSGDRRVI